MHPLRNSSISELHLLVVSVVVSDESGWMIGWKGSSLQVDKIQSDLWGRDFLAVLASGGHFPFAGPSIRSSKKRLIPVCGHWEPNTELNSKP